ncbi:MAG: tyrosine-protein phosphatase [Atopobiaceae bacterium]|jgi:protein-tyrosine phosphatase|nr:tyrosine-protein phosphatase [Atopobiaceae bacterium]MCH4179818.1 tyrosine-protein phosphatase [Atopobiaceae bacterium]MCH4213569.1 tyrosine-protein phosphatase [Atopobiaceae bacterium]MCH4230044.1 tyrosine-protein phosphatase [Atopobiaceae bacterium]MCH4276217.1 tyrosine-protein phosphatase [Atopobiaceae bacterium]
MSDATKGATFSTQAITLPDVHNARDMGGYVGADGSQVRRGLLLRTGDLDDATEEGMRILEHDLDLSLVIDLRTTPEIKSRPDPDIPGVRQVTLHVFDESREGFVYEVFAGGNFSDRKSAMLSLFRIVDEGLITDDIYVRMLADPYTIAAYHTFFDLVCGCDEGALIAHCTGGKDRTGMASAFLLTALGVSREDVIRDYLITNEAKAADIAEVDAYIASLTDDKDVQAVVHKVAGAWPAFMGHVFDHAEAEHGSLLGYLKEVIGVGDDQIALLRSRYLV